MKILNELKIRNVANWSKFKLKHKLLEINNIKN